MRRTVMPVGIESGFRGVAMQAVCSGMEDDTAGPDGLEVLHTKWVGQESLCLGAYGNLEGASASSGSLTARIEHAMAFGDGIAVGLSARRGSDALQGVEVVGQGVDELSDGELFEQPRGQELRDEGSCLADADIARVGLRFLVELKAICKKSVECGAREVRCADLLLYWLDQELRNLGRPQLIPRQSGFASLDDELTDGVGEAVDGEGVCGGGSSN